jgi:hypothetical protein
VGLEAALYNYTKLTTCGLIDYAERGGLLSINQWGFRPKRGTTQPLEMLIYALEDAKIFRIDIYLLMIDFTAGQDKLLMIMYDLGFPADAIEVGRASCGRSRGWVRELGGIVWRTAAGNGAGQHRPAFSSAIWPRRCARGAERS